MSSRYEYAGFGARLLALIIDVILLAIVAFIVGMVAGMLGWIDLEAMRLAQEKGEITTFEVVWNIVTTIAFIVMWVVWAGTPGKLLLKLKILDAETGNKISVVQAIIRYLMYIPSTIVLFLGFFWILFDKHKQGWHDKVAKTVVVKDHRG